MHYDNLFLFFLSLYDHLEPFFRFQSPVYFDPLVYSISEFFPTIMFIWTSPRLFGTWEYLSFSQQSLTSTPMELCLSFIFSQVLGAAYEVPKCFGEVSWVSAIERRECFPISWSPLNLLLALKFLQKMSCLVTTENKA